MTLSFQQVNLSGIATATVTSEKNIRKLGAHHLLVCTFEMIDNYCNSKAKRPTATQMFDST